MESFLISTGAVVLAEMGDKTQLLAFLLASRFKKSLPIILGIFFATIINHGLAGFIGSLISSYLSPAILKIFLVVSFLVMSIWILLPDKGEEDSVKAFGSSSFTSIFFITLTTFFLAEIGDKTQIATIALAAQFSSTVTVVAGTTLGMLIADIPAVYLGDRLTTKISPKLIRRVCSIFFAVIGLAIACETLPPL